MSHATVPPPPPVFTRSDRSLILLLTPLLLASLTAQVAAPQASADARDDDDKNAEVVVLPEFAVNTARSSDDFNAKETLGAMRVNTALIDAPINVTVLTPEFIEALMLDNEHEQISVVAGGNAIASWQDGSGGDTPTQLRGFGTGYFRNGFRRWGPNSSANVERVEYIKGPLAATFGRTEPGGLVNYITKRAQRRPAYNFSARTGSYGYQSISAGATGPLSKNVFYRADLEYNYREGMQDFFHQRMYAASASLTWQISRSTVWMFDFEHKLTTLNPGSGAPVQEWAAGTFIPAGSTTPIATAVEGGRLTSLATFNARGPDAYVHRKTSTFDTRFEHRFTRHLSLRVNGQYTNGEYMDWQWSSIGNYRMATGLITGLIPQHRRDPRHLAAGQADLLGTFKIGATSHKLLLTMDAASDRGHSTNLRMSAENLAALPSTARNLDPLNPDWAPWDRSLFTEYNRDLVRNVSTVGFLLSESMEMFEGRLRLYAALRYDDFHGRTINYVTPSQSAEIRRNMLNETYGAVFHVIPGKLTAYVNRSTSFSASLTVDLGTGKLQEPPTARGVEAGLRGEIIKDPAARSGLYWSASLYRIDRKVPVRNPHYGNLDPDAEEGYDYDAPQYINSGIERVDGVELSLLGELSRQVSLSLTYTKLDAYNKSYAEDPAREGIPILYIPDTTITSTFRYRVTEGRLKGLSFGGVMRYNSEYFAVYGQAASQVTGSDTFSSNLRLHYGPSNIIEEIRPAVTLFDALIEYEFRGNKKYRHSLGMNIKNLTDLTWYARGGQLNLGRQIFLRYRLRF